MLVAVIDNTTGATLLSCTLTSTSKGSCSNASRSGSAAPPLTLCRPIESADDTGARSRLGRAPVVRSGAAAFLQSPAEASVVLPGAPAAPRRKTRSCLGRQPRRLLRQQERDARADSVDMTPPSHFRRQ